MTVEDLTALQQMAQEVENAWAKEGAITAAFKDLDKTIMVSLGSRSSVDSHPTVFTHEGTVSYPYISHQTRLIAVILITTFCWDTGRKWEDEHRHSIHSHRTILDPHDPQPRYS